MFRTCRWRVRTRAPLAAALLFGGALVPVLGFFNVYAFLYSYVADHWQYLPCLAVLALLAAGIAQALGRTAPAVRWGLPVALVGALATLSFHQSRMYADLPTFYRTTLERNPACWMAHNNLGMVLCELGRLPTVLKFGGKWNEEAREHNNLDAWSIVEDAAGVTQRVDAPNPALLPEFIRKYDARLADYFSGRSPGQLSVSALQFDVRNLRETYDYTAEEFGIDDPEFADFIFRSTRNSDRSRRNRNLEFSYQQTLGFLPDRWRGTSCNLAYTRSYANSRRNGMAPHRITSRLGYAYRRFNGSLGMVWIDDRPDGNYGFFRSEQTQFDTSLNWRLSGRLSLYVQGRNITNQPVKWFVSPPGVIEGKDAPLRQYQEYGANWVFGVKGQF